MKTKASKKPLTFASYEEWAKLVDLHEAYKKHDFPVDANGYDRGEPCSICGYPKASEIRHALDSQRVTDMAGPLRKFIFRKLSPALETYHHYWWTPVEAFRILDTAELEYLLETAGSAWAAWTLGTRGTMTVELRAAVLTNSQTAKLLAEKRSAPNDEERMAVCTQPRNAVWYAARIDKCYHVHTRMGAMKEPGTALQYWNDWKDDFILSEAERKRIATTKVGASMLSCHEGVDRPEYRKTLSDSKMYAHKYIMDVVGERCPDMEAGSIYSYGLSMLEYMSAFDLKAEDVNMPSCGNFGPDTCIDSRKIYDAMLACRAIVANGIPLTPDIVLDLKFKHRARMAIGYVMATRRCEPEIYKALGRSRSFRGLLHSLERTLRHINETRVRLNKPVISCDFSGLPENERWG